VSKVLGFDSLVGLLKSKHVKVRRHDDWSGLHFTATPKPVTEVRAPVPTTRPTVAVAKPPAPKPLSGGAEKVLSNLKKSVKNRPRRKQTLVNHAKNFFGKETAADAVERVVAELQKAGHLSIDEKGTVTYKL